jgi:hypothetical protein
VKGQKEWVPHPFRLAWLHLLEFGWGACNWKVHLVAFHAKHPAGIEEQFSTFREPIAAGCFLVFVHPISFADRQWHNFSG